MDDRNFIFTQFQQISNKLKKRRILKKPNVTEVSQQFENLGVTCEADDLPQYAGFCYQAAANCQSSLGNTSEQAHLLLKASRQFRAGYLKCFAHNMACTDENFHDALVCHRACIESYASIQDSSVPNMKPILAGITMEMADTLKSKLGDMESAVNEYKKTLNFLDGSPVEKINCLKKLISCKIELGDYDDALQFTNQLIDETQMIPKSSFRDDIMQMSEITRILLLLLLQPTPQQISPSAAAILEKYAWVETTDSNEIADLQTTLASNCVSISDEKLFLCLQSLVMAFQYGERDCLVTLENELVPYLSCDQRSLLRTLVQKKVDK